MTAIDSKCQILESVQNISIYTVYTDIFCTLSVYNKVTNKTILEGPYKKPNWVVSLEVMKSSDDLDFKK